MALTTGELSEVALLVASAENAKRAAATLRSRLHALRISVQDAADMRDESPALRTARIDVHLMTNRDGHCWGLTADPELASAMVLSDRET